METVILSLYNENGDHSVGPCCIIQRELAPLEKINFLINQKGSK